MNTEWLAAGSFERTHEVISAINTLSINAKLALAGHKSAATIEDVAEARAHLKAFLSRFDHIVREVERNQKGPVLGADPRLGLLAKRFVAEKKQRPLRSSLYTVPIERLIALIDSERAEDQKDLIDSLRDLRTLVEQHAHADVVGILGEI